MGRRLRTAGRRLLRRLPRTPAFDRLHALIHFLYAHRRIPRRSSGLFNDHLFFLKTGPELRDPLRRITSDKVYAKHFIDGIVGRKATPETHAVFESVETISRRALPARCVLKPAHGVHYIVILDGADTELSDADRDRLRRGLASDPYLEDREVNYQGLRKRLICEELVARGDIIKDYKLFCYLGQVRVVYICHRIRAEDAPMAQNFYDNEWNRLEIVHNHRPIGEWEEEPAQFPEMRAMAEAIAQHFAGLVRVDMYLEDGKIYIGELTHCHNQANAVFGSLEEERLISRVLFG